MFFYNTNTGVIETYKYIRLAKMVSCKKAERGIVYEENIT
jgi:hypothetical protein